MTFANLSSPDLEVECVLSASKTYIETLTLKPVPAQPWLIDLVIRTQLLTAKNPLERRVKARCCIERSRLVELQKGIAQFLEATSDS
jgi:hypothetical protein